MRLKLLVLIIFLLDAYFLLNNIAISKPIEEVDDSIPKIFKPGIISSKYYEFGGMLSPNGDTFYFTRRKNYNGFDNKIYCCKIINGVWQNPEPAFFSSSSCEMLPYFAPDGKRIYYYSEERNTILNENNIRFVEFEKGEWSLPKKLDIFNNVKGIMNVSSTLLGTLYYNGISKNSKGIFRSVHNNGTYEKPEFLDTIINKYYPAHPFIAPDESYIIFDSQKSGRGNSKIYISFKNKKGYWSEPKNIGEIINKTGTEFAGSISFDGKYFLFHRRENNNGDIYIINAKMILGDLNEK